MKTETDTDWVELVRLPITKMQDVLLARFVARDAAVKLGYAPEFITRLVTAISEITRNVVQHADGPGEFKLGRVPDAEKHGFRIIVVDEGKGIEEPERFNRISESGAVGSGLPGARTLVDRFHLHSAPGTGTTVTMDLWEKPVAVPS